MNSLVPLPVVMPLLGAALTLVLARRPRAQRVVSVLVLTATLAVAAGLLVAAYRDGPLVVNVGGWPAPVGIVLVADQLSALMLVVSAAVTLCVLLYSIGEGRADGDEGTPLAIYHPTYLVLTAGVTNAFLSGICSTSSSASRFCWRPATCCSPWAAPTCGSEPAPPTSWSACSRR